MAGTVLVVEDEECMRDCAVDAISDCGYCVHGFASAEAALLFLENHANDIELVFTDNSLAGEMDGVELAAIIRARWPRIQVLVTSGNEGVARLLPEGTDFLPKPWRIPQLIRYLDLHCRNTGDTSMPGNTDQP